MKVASLRVVEGSKAPWRGSVIPRRLVGESGKGIRVGIHNGGSKPPGVGEWLGSRKSGILFFGFRLTIESSGEIVSVVDMVVAMRRVE